MTSEEIKKRVSEIEQEDCFWCCEPIRKREDSFYSSGEGIGPFCYRCWDDLRDTFSEDVGHQKKILKQMTNIAHAFSDWAAEVDHHHLDEANKIYSERRERIEEDFESVLKRIKARE